MDKTRLTTLWLVTAVISAMLLVTSDSFPYFGLAFFFAAAAGWAYLGTKTPTIWTTVLAGSIGVFSLMLFWWANPTLTVLNLITILTLGALLVSSPHLNIPHPLQILSNYILVFVQLWEKKARFSWQQLLNKSQLSGGLPRNYKAIAASLFLTILIGLILIQSFSSANPLFAHISSRITNALTTFELGENLDQWLGRLILFVLISLFFSRLAGSSDKLFGQKKFINQDFPLLLPKIATAVLSLAFILSHGLLLVNPQAVYVRINVTHSQTTREIFAQMALASFISLCLLTLKQDKATVNRIVSWVLWSCVIILITIGLQSDYQYIKQFGFTHKRLYGLASVLWLYVITGIVAYWLKKGGEFLITRAVVAVTIGVILLINIANFDGLIAHHSPRIASNAADFWYLSRLSADAGSLWNEFQAAKDAQEASLAKAFLIRLQNRIGDDSTFDGSFNVSHYRLAREAKLLPLEENTDEINKMLYNYGRWQVEN